MVTYKPKGPCKIMIHQKHTTNVKYIVYNLDEPTLTKINFQLSPGEYLICISRDYRKYVKCWDVIVERYEK